MLLLSFLFCQNRVSNSLNIVVVVFVFIFIVVVVVVADPET